MNNDLISRDALLKEILFCCNQEIVKYKTMRRALGNVGRVAFDCTKNAPAVDAAPVRHGRWVSIAEPVDVGVFTCSECYSDRYFGDWTTTSADAAKMARYCPECGSKMDAEVE